jgi:hypothetical protein
MMTSAPEILWGIEVTGSKGWWRGSAELLQKKLDVF